MKETEKGIQDKTSSMESFRKRSGLHGCCSSWRRDNSWNRRIVRQPVQITATVVQAVRAGTDPQVTAQKIAALARQSAHDKNRQTPFSTAAQDAGFRYYGGKLDDIVYVNKRRKRTCVGL
ncbi:unnamed protein product [Brassica rapa subsp. narinosa]